MTGGAAVSVQERHADRLETVVQATSHPVLRPVSRPHARGKFLSVDGEKLFIKGVTYGTFRPDPAGNELHQAGVVIRDFAAMHAAGINAIRTYTTPPRWLLDCAAEHGLRVLVGLPWEQHVTFLDDKRRAASIVEEVRSQVARCAGHPAVLAYAVGNEIPAPIVRWHGRAKVERFVERLYWAAKDADDGALVTYVNYPSTEYLELPFLDLCSFNVYLETPEKLDAYLARLHNIAGDRPLLLAEVGLDSCRNGLATQATILEWQLRSIFAAGAAGTFVFAWTDEWHRGGYDIDDWDFGLTDRLRTPKPALAAVERVYRTVPFARREWPRVSVVVCSLNGGATIGRTCSELRAVDYPNMETIVVDDGSTDATASIAEAHGFNVIRTENGGLSAARNIGAAAATGEYVAYLDDDAWPDRHWLKYLVHTFEKGGFAAAGGPNVPPAGESLAAQCVARAPGGPIHVLFDDVRAEHIPGCNLAIRRTVLQEIGGFDARFRVAGDDVDLCWRLYENGHEIGFSPGAMVWHKRRESLRGYLRQQRGYGRAEALLERKWPEKYNIGGHPIWRGRIYGPGGPLPIGRRWRVYYGTWGQGLFQRLYARPPSVVASLPLTPEWWLLLGALAALSMLALAWTPFVIVCGLFALALGSTVGGAILAANRSWTGDRPPVTSRLLTALMHLVQPVARLVGRIGDGLRPWWRRHSTAFAAPVRRRVAIWSEAWRPMDDRVAAVERALLDGGVAPIHGGDFDRWDLEVRGGLLGGARIRHAVEEHGAGRQLVRFELVPRVSGLTCVLVPVLLVPALAASFAGAWVAVALLVALTIVVVVVALREAALATSLALNAATATCNDDVSTVLLGRLQSVKASAPEVPEPAS